MAGVSCGKQILASKFRNGNGQSVRFLGFLRRNSFISLPQLCLVCMSLPCLLSHDPTPYRTWLGASPKMLQAAEGKAGTCTMANALGFRKKDISFWPLDPNSPCQEGMASPQL